MNAIRVLRHIDSEVVHAIPELQELLGHDAEITAVPRPADESVETVETFLGGGLDRPAATPEEMAELRALAAREPGIAAMLRLAEDGGLDLDTILTIRNAG